MTEWEELEVNVSRCDRRGDEEGSQDNEADSDGGAGELNGDEGIEDAPRDPCTLWLLPLSVVVDIRVSVPRSSPPASLAFSSTY